MGFDYVSRLERVTEAMHRYEVDTLLLSVGADMPWLFGYGAMALERVTMAIVRPGTTPVLVVPELEAPRVDDHGGVFDVVAWGELEDPIGIIADRVGTGVAIAMGDQTWTTFTLALQGRLGGRTWESAGPIMADMRMVKEDEELDRLRTAGASADRVAARLANYSFGGKTERHVATDIAAMLIEEGHDTTWDVIVASGRNGASPHHGPGDRVIRAGDPIVCDFGGTMAGYTSDTTRNFVVGTPPPEYLDMFSVLMEAQEAGVRAATVGTPCREVDRVTRNVIENAGYGEFFVHRTGHGIGLEVHEAPYIVEGNDLPLAPGMAFSVEPGIYIPGRFGMRIEDIVIATDHGPQRCNNSTRDLVIVE
ncbi:xaa-Pro dipeptidase [bacterium BMS3Bbin02]|nr:xaa-Pro dipeptidase [bacterium BMS3Bbin02]